jgi:hypothetical protein
MTLPARTFDGATFFRTIRADMNRNRGLAAGMDGGMAFVCMDASFYRMDLLIRPTNQTFTVAARALPREVRAVANGQIFGTGVTDYCYTVPCRVQWQGEVVVSGSARAGNPRSAPRFRYFGQWGGCSQVSFGTGTGDPSSVTPTFQNAMGRLLPLVEGGTGAASGPLGDWWTRPATQGKAVYGLCRAEQVVFLLVQRDSGNGLTVPNLIRRLTSMGVEDAMMGDGSDSATLLVDGTVEVQPGRVKNNSIPVGPMFRLHSLRLTGTRSMRNDTPDAARATTDPQLQTSLEVNDQEGTIRLTNSGLELEITSLGLPFDPTVADLTTQLGVTLPLRLTAPSSLLTSAATLSGPRVSGQITLAPQQTQDGVVTGQLTFTTRRGAARFDVSWEVEDGP